MRRLDRTSSRHFKCCWTRVSSSATDVCFSPPSRLGTQGELLDRTGREALVNHIHVDGQLPANDSAEAVSQALRYARAVAERLDSDYPGSAFHVVLAIGDSATVRFYRLRANEAPWIPHDLEGYENEAVLVLTVG